MSNFDAASRINELQPKIFAELNGDDIKSIASAAKVRSVPRGSTIIHQAQSANCFGLLLTGRARHYYTTPEGQGLILMWITPGECFGVAGLVPMPSSYLASVETVRDSNLLMWESATIRRFVVKYPKILDNALIIASRYIDWCISSHVALTCKAAPERLAHVLATLASTIGTRMGKGIELDITNEELASAASITPFTTSRLLARWHDQELICKSRGRISLHSPNRLWHNPL